VHLHAITIDRAAGEHTERSLILDLCADPGTTRDTEIDRLPAPGATLAQDRRAPDGTGWAVLRDPEGHESCVVRADHER
jgi:hypothetical protein